MKGAINMWFYKIVDYTIGEEYLIPKSAAISEAFARYMMAAWYDKPHRIVFEGMEWRDLR
jgi:hypothetical protein